GEAGGDHVQSRALKRDTNGGMLPAGEGTRGTQSSTASSVLMYRETCAKCGAKRIDSQLGLEPTPEEYVANMVAGVREVRRVRRDDGTLWCNMGDGYASQGHQNGKDVKGAHLVGGGLRSWGENRQNVMPTVGLGGLKPKDLIGMPWRLAFALQADGWYL